MTAPRIEITGLVFVGTRTPARALMARFVEDVLGLRSQPVDGVDAPMYAVPDGSTFAVTDADADDPGSRTIGFEVADIEDAVQALEAAGVATDGIATNAAYRYAHFTAPDGALYELVERRERQAGRETVSPCHDRQSEA